MATGVNPLPSSFNPIAWTNAAKVQILALVNATLALVMAFGFALSTEQMAVIISFVNAVLAIFGVTTKDESPVAKYAAAAKVATAKRNAKE